MSFLDMEVKSNNYKTALDKLLLLLSIAIVFSGVIFYNTYPLMSGLLRILVLLSGIGLGVIILYQTSTGKNLWSFILTSRVELRKIVWPTRQETTQMTLVVVAFTFVMALFFWLLDMFLLWATRLLTGQGG
jgi:preprotein translocase subunit SecE